MERGGWRDRDVVLEVRDPVARVVDDRAIANDRHGGARRSVAEVGEDAVDLGDRRSIKGRRRRGIIRSLFLSPRRRGHQENRQQRNQHEPVETGPLHLPSSPS